MILRLVLLGISAGLSVLVAAAAKDLQDPGSGTSTIVGSKHDFSQQAWSQRQICLPCHTPHSATAPEMAPLWDRNPSANTSYTLYNDSRGLPGAASLVCLSCHDGSTAVDSYGGMSGEVFIQDIGTGSGLIGANSDLRGNHPIGVRYPELDRGFRDRIQVESEGYVVLPQGRVECLSCHDVHNQYGGEKLLVKSNDRSGLCLTCHRK